MLVEIQFVGVSLLIKRETRWLSKDSDRRAGQLLYKAGPAAPQATGSEENTERTGYRIFMRKSNISRSIY